MDYLFQGGSKTKSKKTSSKKGGNFLGSVGELVAPSGWESFATTAGLFALDRADAALRRGKTTAKKGGQSKTSSKKTSSKKGGNFLGAVGDLVAPTGWESFATAAGLLAIDRADAALRRGKSVKNSAKKMSGGMDPPSLVKNTSGNFVTDWGNGTSNNKRLQELYKILNLRTDKNSVSYKALLEQIKNLEKEIERKKILKQKKEENNKIIQNTKRFNEKTRNYVQDFIAGIFLPGDDYTLEDDRYFRYVLSNSTGIKEENELTRIIEEAKIARKNRKNRFKTTKATLNSIPKNTMWAYKR
jgi:hypothetical protein